VRLVQEQAIRIDEMIAEIAAEQGREPEEVKEAILMNIEAPR
jgi:hypothetical protein